MINISLPIKAISINQSFQGKRFKTKECKKFELDAHLLMPQREMIKGKVEIVYEFYLKYAEKTDVSNLIKVIEDLIVKRGWIQDDRKVWSFQAFKYKVKKETEEKINIIITPYED